MAYVPRLAAARLRRRLRQFPAVLVLGPRQCGKTTFVRTELPGFTHVDLERPTDSRVLAADVEGFLEAHPRRLAIDEAQRMPELFPALRHAIDADRRPGRFVLTGSASPSLMRGVSESLAGRVALIELPPFLAAELAGTRRAADRWFWGGFPPVHAARGAAARAAWIDAHVTTFLERDVPALGVRLPVQRLRTLWTMLTHVHGGLLNLSELARALSVSYHTVAEHLDLLEGAFMIRRLPPYFANVGKRLVKHPKVYVRDTGILHFLGGLRRPGELEAWPRRGASFEGLVIEEIAAQLAERVVRPELYFWRTAAGAEVDLLVKAGQRLLPVEVRLGAAPDARALAGLRQCMADLGLHRGWVVCTARERRTLGRGIEMVPWAELAAGRVEFGC